MKKKTALINVLYGYISFAFFMVFLSILGLFHPWTDIIAAITLITACYYVGRYGNLKSSKD